MSLKTKSFYRFVAAPVFALGLGLPAVINCSDAVDAAQGCDEFNSADYGASLSIDVRVKSFMRAAGSFRDLGEQMVAEVSTACVNIAKAAKRDESKWAGKEGNELVTAACAEASAGVDAVFGAAAALSINLLVEGGRCEASIDAATDCNAQCDLSGKCTPAQLEAQCEPGKLAFECSAECSGACEADVGATVECDGTCSATCNGDCTANGNTNKVDGKCDGRCEGTCSGECVLETNAKVTCSGTCRGECSGEIKEPHCEGKFQPPECMVDADCSANCNASVQAKAECTPPKVTFDVTGGVATGDLTGFIEVLKVELPKLLVNFKDRGDALVDSAAAIEASAKGVLDAAGTSGKAFVCATAAASAAVDASVNVKVSVEASANVSGRAAAGGGT